MTKRKERELAKAKDKKPKWNATKSYKLTDLTEEQALAKGETVYKAWKQVTDGAKSVPLHERTNIFKI